MGECFQCSYLWKVGDRVIKTIYGAFEVNRRIDYLIIFLKGLYVIYTLPFLIGFWILLIAIPWQEEDNFRMKVLLNLLANISSPIGYLIFYHLVKDLLI